MFTTHRVERRKRSSVLLERNIGFCIVALTISPRTYAGWVVNELETISKSPNVEPDGSSVTERLTFNASAGSSSASLYLNVSDEILGNATAGSGGGSASGSRTLLLHWDGPTADKPSGVRYLGTVTGSGSVTATGTATSPANLFGGSASSGSGAGSSSGSGTGVSAAINGVGGNCSAVQGGYLSGSVSVSQTGASGSLANAAGASGTTGSFAQSGSWTVSFSDDFCDDDGDNGDMNMNLSLVGGTAVSVGAVSGSANGTPATAGTAHLEVDVAGSVAASLGNIRSHERGCDCDDYNSPEGCQQCG